MSTTMTIRLDDDVKDRLEGLAELRIPVGIAVVFRGNAGNVLETANRVTSLGQSGEISGTSRPSCSICAFQRW